MLAFAAMKLVLSRSVIRPWRAGDEPFLRRNADDRRVWINLRDAFPHPYSDSDAEQWVRHAAAQDPTTDFAIEVGGEPVGGIGLKPGEDVHWRSAEVGYWLGAAYWGRGIASEALAAFSTWALSRFDLLRLHAAVFEWNPASMRVLEKCGYTREGVLKKSVVKDGRAIDQVMYALVP